MTNIPLIVDSEWLASRLDDPNLRLLDASTFLSIPDKDGAPGLWSGEKAFAEEHIPGAVFADVLKSFSDSSAPLPMTVPSREQFVEEIEKLGVGEGTYVVIYDRGALANADVIASYWASRLRWQLKYEGFDNVAVLDGGLVKWKQEGRPVTTETRKYPKGKFNYERRPHLVVNKEEVRTAIEDDNVVLINSLSPADFYGETNTYPRKGHIPTSENVFFGSHSDPATRLLFDDETLRATFEKIGALDSSKKVITYCGGGIAATWNALLLNKLGQENVAIYDGSMNEWAADETCPLVTKK